MDDTNVFNQAQGEEDGEVEAGGAVSGSEGQEGNDIPQEVESDSDEVSLQEDGEESESGDESDDDAEVPSDANGVLESEDTQDGDPELKDEDEAESESASLPTLESLTELKAPNQMRDHEFVWGSHCNRFAEENGYYFLGFCPKSGEPLFKKIK